MIIGRSIIVGIALACAVALPSGCNLDKPYPGRAYFTIDVTPPSTGPSSAAASEMVLRVAEARVAHPFDEVAFHYQRDASAFEKDYYVNFITRPSNIVTGSLISWLEAAGPYGTVVDSSSPAGTGRTLETRVSKLYADFTDGNAPKAVVTVKFFLLDDTDVEARVLFDQEYTESIATNGVDSASLVDGWSTGLSRIFATLSDDLARVEG